MCREEREELVGKGEEKTGRSVQYLLTTTQSSLSGEPC